MVRWVIRWIPQGGSIELFIPASALLLVVCDNLTGMVHIKEPLLLIRKSSHVVAVTGFLYQYLRSPFHMPDAIPYA